MGIKIKVNSSSMSSYKWCPRKWRIKNVEKIELPYISPALNLGSVVHKEIDNFWKEYHLDLDTFIPDINEYYKRTVKKVIDMLCDESYVKFQLYFSNFTNFMIRRLKRYIEMYGIDNYDKIKMYFYPILSEKYGRIKITADIDFSFIVDALFKGDSGNILIDWKTDKDCNESKFRSHVPQLDRYSSCLTRIGHRNNFIGIFFLKDSLYFQDLKTYNYSLKNEVILFVRKIQVSDFPKVPVKENYKCCTNNYQCEYYPEICSGSF